MNRHSINTFSFVPPAEKEDQLHLFALENLLPPGQALTIGTKTLIVSLVYTAPVATNPILRQRVLTEPELRVLLPLLLSPRYCSHEFLSASRRCGFEVLLAGLFAPLPRRGAWLQEVEDQLALLERAREQGIWKKTFRDVYYALSDLRGKMHAFGLEVARVHEGYALARYGPELAGQTCSCRPRQLIQHASRD